MLVVVAKEITGQKRKQVIFVLSTGMILIIVIAVMRQPGAEIK